LKFTVSDSLILDIDTTFVPDSLGVNRLLKDLLGGFFNDFWLEAFSISFLLERFFIVFSLTDLFFNFLLEPFSNLSSSARRLLDPFSATDIFRDLEVFSFNITGFDDFSVPDWYVCDLVDILQPTVNR